MYYYLSIFKTVVKLKKIDTNLLDKHSKGGYSSYKLLFQISSVSYSNILII